MAYVHKYLDGNPVPLPVGKAVCIGRNYLEHIRELGNPVPTRPMLFMKPATALVGLEAPLRLPENQGSCHHEVELAALIGRPLWRTDAQAVRAAIAGYGVALDLTLRELQAELKASGQPWELAKAFDGACPVSPFLKPEALVDPQNTDLTLEVNGELRQQGNTRLMIMGIFQLIAYISSHFTLLPGDLVLTGTPAGIGELRSGDELVLTLDRYRFTAQVG